MSSNQVSRSGSASTSSSKQRSEGGRKGSIQVPCNDCIARASQGGSNRTNMKLCDECMRMLRRPRRRQQQATGTSRMPLQKDSFDDIASGTQNDPVTLIWSEDCMAQSLQYFTNSTSPRLDAHFDSQFWKTILLQMDQQQPAARHAIKAIGALHEILLCRNYVADSGQNEQIDSALEQCNKSIQCLIRHVDGQKPPDLKLLLASCVLFTCSEAMQGHCEQALAHISRGYGLLERCANNPAKAHYEAEEFGAEFDLLCLVVRTVETQAKHTAWNAKRLHSDTEVSSIPNPVHFETLHDARASLETVIKRLSTLYRDLDFNDELFDLVSSNRDDFLHSGQWLVAWEDAFSKLLARNQATLSRNEREGAMALKAHHLVCIILNNMDLSAGELGWDRFLQEFTAIVDLAAAIPEGNVLPGSGPRTRQTEVCFGLTIEDPLYEVCARCRDPVIRRRALDLLSRYPRQNRILSSWSAWKVDKYLIHFGEDKSRGSSHESMGINAEDQTSSFPWNEFPEPLVRGEGGTGCLMYNRMHPYRRPREALNPGLFVGDSMGRFSDQDNDTVQHALLGNNFVERLGDPPDELVRTAIFF